MGNRICNQEAGRHPNAKQNAETYSKGELGDRASNLVRLIGAERVSRREFQYEGTYYVTEYGEMYDKEYIDIHKPPRTGINFYEVTNWVYDERRKMNIPSIRRIVMVKNTNTQLSLNL